MVRQICFCLPDESWRYPCMELLQAFDPSAEAVFDAATVDVDAVIRVVLVEDALQLSCIEPKRRSAGEQESASEHRSIGASVEPQRRRPQAADQKAFPLEGEGGSRRLTEGLSPALLPCGAAALNNIPTATHHHLKPH